MVNFGLNAAAILGLFLAVAGAGLFFLRSIRPELARDYDIFFAAVGLLCGIILLFNGWRLDPILQFGQFLLTGTTIFFAFESIRMRSVATEQARRNTPIVDRDRPVSRSRVYTEAEVDRIDPYEPYDNVYEGVEPNYNSPRLNPYDDPNPRTSRRPDSRRRPSPTRDYRDEEPQRRPSRNRPSRDEYSSPREDRNGDRSSRPRRRPNPSASDNYDDWSDSPRTASRPRPRPSREPREDIYSNPTPTSPTRRRPSPADLGRSYEPEDSYDEGNSGNSYDDRDLGRSYEEDDSSIPGDYVVDYQPVDKADDDRTDNYNSGDGYDNYDNGDDYGDRNSDDEYDDDGDRGRKPINFDR